MTSGIKDSYWRKAAEIVGPARVQDFHLVGQKDTRDALEAWVLAVSTPSTSLLDAGCNTGVEGYRLFEKGYIGRYTGADSNPKALMYALENLSSKRAAFSLTDLDALGFRDQEFDITINKDVIEHLPYYDETLKELARVTKHALALSTFISLHEGDDLINRHPDGYYLNAYNRQRLYNLFGTCGFRSAATIFKNATDEVIVFERA